MIDELLGQLFGEGIFRRYTPSRRTQLLTRLFFGLFGFVLGLVGGIHILTRSAATGAHMRIAMALLLLSFGTFWLLNVGLARKWRWPGVLTVASLVALIAARLVLGP